MNTKYTTLYAFILGREYKLSLAELGSVFWFENCKFFNETIALFDIQTPVTTKTLSRLGGTIRIIKILSEIEPQAFPTTVLEHIYSTHTPGKLSFALGSYGTNLPISEMGMRMKKSLSEKHFSARLINAKNENLHAAVFKKEKLAKSQSEFILIATKKHEKNSEENTLSDTFFVGYTVACQDIDAYSRRDTAKNRDMIVGMMPPKLVQMMIHMWWVKSSESIYDPFCGLGTTLIEAANMGITTLFWSDISSEMTKSTKLSVENFVKEESLWQERIRASGGNPDKDFRNLKVEVFTLDATKIERAFSEKHLPKNVCIVTEGYLGKIMKKHEINQDLVFSERRTIERMYDLFFKGLKTANYTGTILMSFPFWKVGEKLIFLQNIPEILEKYGFKIIGLLPRDYNLNTKNGSLLYRRESQLVGREIMKIVRK